MIFIVAVFGYGDLVVEDELVVISKKSVGILSIFSIVLFILSVFLYKVYVFKWVAVLFVFIVYESIIFY